MRCTKKGCGSYAINEHSYDRERGVDSDLCDVHYWMKRASRIAGLEGNAENAKALSQQIFPDSNWAEEAGRAVGELVKAELDKQRANAVNANLEASK